MNEECLRRVSDLERRVDEAERGLRESVTSDVKLTAEIRGTQNAQAENYMRLARRIAVLEQADNNALRAEVDTAEALLHDEKQRKEGWRDRALRAEATLARVCRDLGIGCVDGD